MNAEELVRAGKPEEALASLQEAIRAKPQDPSLRVFLFQLMSVLGQWERAGNQLEVLGQIHPEALLLARLYQPVLQCEILREEIFAGRRAPVIFGEPEPWVSFLVQANELVARGEFAAAEELRDKALDAAPATSGKINGAPFAWLADADSRMGPMLELILNGRYYWVPLHRIRKLQLPAPTDLRDLLWAPTTFQWVNGGEAAGHIPVRYPGTQSSADGQLRLARRTDWIEKPNGCTLGQGQRLLTTDQQDYPLLETREVELAAS
jgi:type VI secretion system protein ImpE